MVVVLQIACQLGLLLIDDQRFRLPLRVATFAISLTLLWRVRPESRRHPATWLATLAVLVLCFGIFNPQTVGVVPALASIMLQLSILAPLWWAVGGGADFKAFRAVLLTLWVFQSASALLGVLQLQFPGRFDFQVSAVLLERGDATLEGMRFTLPTGERVFRPMGLTDVPGGAAAAGMISFVIAMGLVVTARNPWLLAAAGLSMINALFCILTSHVRSTLVVCGVCLVMLLGVLLFRGGQKLLRVALVAGCVGIVATVWAFRVGGDEVVFRVWTLFEDDPTSVYMRNRGAFLLFAIFEYAPQYPFGAGLGRWGMINTYFARFGDNQIPPLWAEIQWEAWILDGGVPLALVYGAAIAVATWYSFRMALDSKIGSLADWSAVVFGYNMAAIAVTFNYPLFISQGGMDFWLINALLFGAVQSTLAARRGSAALARSTA